MATKGVVTFSQVIIQFSFSNPKIVPSKEIVNSLDPENPHDSYQRHNLSANRVGVQLIEPSNKGDTSLLKFLNDLSDLGYELVNAQSQDRYNNEKSYPGRVYRFSTVRYHFVHSSLAHVSPEWKKKQEAALDSLRNITKTSIWRIRVYSNPVITDTGEVNPATRLLSFNAEVRQPLVYPNGDSIVVYPLDAEKKRTGDPALPLQPDYEIRFVDNEVLRIPFS